MATRKQRFNDLSVNSQRLVTSAGDWLRTAELVANNSGGGTAATIAYSGDTPANYTADSADIEGHLSGIDTAIGAVSIEFSGAMMRLNSGVSSQSFTASRQKVDWRVETYDVGGWVDIASDPHVLTVPTGVTKVNVDATIYVADFITDEPAEYYMYLMHDDGVTPVELQEQREYHPDPTVNSVNSATKRLKLSAKGIACVAGDDFYIEFQTNGAAHNRMIYYNTTESMFSIKQVG